MATREELLDMIPRERTLRAPAPVEPNFLRDSEFGRNVGNIVNAMGASRAASSLLRGGSALDALRAGSIAARVAQPVAMGAALPAVAAATDLRSSEVPEQPRTADTPKPQGFVGPTVDQNPNGVVTKDGNSYSGDNIKEGFSFQDGRAAPGINSLPNESFQSDLRAAARFDARQAQATPNGGLVFGGNASRLRSNEDFDIRQARDRLDSISRLSRNPRERREAIKALAGLESGVVQNASAERLGQLREQGENARTGATLTQRQREAEMTNERGLREADIGARTKMFEAQRDQANKDREFQFNVQKLGVEEANRIRDDRVKADENLTKKLEVLFPGEEGKPDGARVANAFSLANDYIAGQIQQLESIPRSSQQYEAAQRRAGELRRRGADVLDPRELQRVLTTVQLGDVKRETATGFLNPFGTAAGENQGASGLQVQEVRPGVLGIGEDVVLRDGTVIPRRFLKDVNIDSLRN